MKEYSSILENSARSNIGFFLIKNMMGIYTNFILLPLLVIGLILGIFSINSHEDAALYGVSIIFLIEVNNTVSTGLRQIIINENIMISFERLLTITNLKSEKDLIT